MKGKELGVVPIFYGKVRPEVRPHYARHLKVRKKTQRFTDLKNQSTELQETHLL